MRNPLTNTLIALEHVLQSTRDHWWIFGSTALALHGYKDEMVNDIDVIISSNDAIRLMNAYNLKNEADGGTKRFHSSIILRPVLGDIQVELFANFKTFTKGSWQAIRPVTRYKIMVEDAAIFVPNRVELAGIFKACGRNHDIRRAKLLRQGT